MSIQTIVKRFCDSCHKTISNDKYHRIFHNNKNTDICVQCVNAMINLVLGNKLWFLRRDCLYCKGKGFTKNMEEYDYDEIPCKFCSHENLQGLDHRGMTLK